MLRCVWFVWYCLRRKASADARVANVVASKEAEAADAVARIAAKLGQLDSKFRGCEEVRTCTLHGVCSWPGVCCA